MLSKLNQFILPIPLQFTKDLTVKSICKNSLTLLASSSLFLVIPSNLLGQTSHTVLAQSLPKSVLSRWQLAFKEYTSNDKTFSFKITGSCPVESPGFKCGYPEPRFLPDNGQVNGVPYRSMNILGGSYEIGFDILVMEIPSMPANNKKIQQAWLNGQIQFWRNKLERETGGRLISSQKITVNGYQGVRLNWRGSRDRSGSSSTAVQIVIVGNRMYQLTASTSDANAALLKRDVQTFLNGLKIRGNASKSY
jgi:hypothetical protein